MSNFSFIPHLWAFAAQKSQDAFYEQKTHETPKYIIDQIGIMDEECAALLKQLKSMLA